MSEIVAGTILLVPRVRDGRNDSYVIGIAERVTDKQIWLKRHPKQPVEWFPTFVRRTAGAVPINEEQVEAALEAVKAYTQAVQVTSSVYEDRRRRLAADLEASFSEPGKVEANG